MKTYCVTCTGGRPEALSFCNRYMSRQIDQNFEWIVVDDGEPNPRETEKIASRADQIFSPLPFDGISLVRNLTLALQYIELDNEHHGDENDFVLIIEDDDWYHGAYTSIMKNRLMNLPAGKMVIGEKFTKYYNVMYRTGWENVNDKHASLCSVGFKCGFLPKLREILKEVDPERPFIDLEIFGRHADICQLWETSMCVGIKGMPGRPGIGGGHRPAAQNHQRDPALQMLAKWTSKEDAINYAPFYYLREAEEAGGLEYTGSGYVPPPASAERKRAVLFRVEAQLPNLQPFADGLYAHGYELEWHNPQEVRNGMLPLADLCVIGGALLRYGALNQQVFDFYRSHKIPVVICDIDRLRPHSIRTWINGEPWMPAHVPSRDRMRKHDFQYRPKPRGENVLIIGQRPDLDLQLLADLKVMRKSTDRQFVFRPHPNMYAPDKRAEYKPITEVVDEVSVPGDRLDDDSRISLENDLDAAWCVVTHSSIVGVQALMRGIPVIASSKIVCPELVTPLHHCHRVEELERPGWDEMQRFFKLLAYTLWDDYECASGEAWEFLRQWI